MPPPGPPYLPQTWSLGGVPKASVDVPVTAVLLLCYMCSAATHMTIFQLNRRHHHKFVMSMMMFGFSMFRSVTCILRITSVSLPTNVHLSVAASIFVAAGTLIIFVLNLEFTKRLMRAQHPHFGWHLLFKRAIIAVYVVMVLSLLMLITSVVQSFYTLSNNTHRIDRDIQLWGSTYFAVVSFLPLPLILLGLLLPRRTRVEKFGSGRFRTKIIVLALATTIISSGAIFRCATTWKTPVPRTRPLPRYFSRACFYVFDFGVEIVVIYLYAALRIDRRFHVPDEAKNTRTYKIGGVYSEEETFDHAVDQGTDAQGDVTDEERPRTNQTEEEKGRKEDSGTAEGETV